MTCQEFRSLIDAYLDGELDTASSEAMRAHLSGCRSCQEEYQDSQRLLAILKHIPDHDPPPGYWDDVTGLILARTVDLEEPAPVREAPRPPRTGRTLMPAVMSLAVSLGLLFAALYIGYRNSDEVARRAYRQAARLNDMSWLSLNEQGSGLTATERADISRSLRLMSPPGPLSRATIANGLPAF